MMASGDSIVRPGLPQLLLRFGLSSFVVSLGWEWGQLPAYPCPADGLAGTLSLLVPAAVGDVALSFILVLVAVAVQRLPACPLSLTWGLALAFFGGGFALAAAIERAALAAGIWSYSALMPLIPGLRVGWLPVLHTMTVPLASAFLAARPGKKQSRRIRDEKLAAETVPLKVSGLRGRGETAACNRLSSASSA